MRTGVNLAPTRTAVSDWGTVHGGGLFSTGIDAGSTGRPATGFLVVDDPFAGFLDGESAVTRENVWNVFWTDLMTRLEGPASAIVVHTRFNQDDLIGRLEAQGGWEIISIPAIAETTPDILGRSAGESFWPDRDQYTVEALDKLWTASPHTFAALYQQSPRGRGRALFGAPTFFDRKKLDLTGCRAIIGVDPAGSEKTSSDWSVATLLALRNPTEFDKAEAYVLNCLRRQTTIPQFARELLAFQRANWNAPVVVEAVGAFVALPQLLREYAPGIQIIELVNREQLHGDKFLRAQGLAAAWAAGRVMVPNDSPPWLEPFLQEFGEFTGTKSDRNDDIVDSVSHAWNTGVAAPTPQRQRGAVAAPGRFVGRRGGDPFSVR